MADVKREEEYGFAEVLGFFLLNWKVLFICGVAGALGSLLYFKFTPSQYEAAAIFELAKVDIDGQLGSVESPAILLERLKSPSAYTPESINSCGLAGLDFPGEALAGMVKLSVPKNTASIVSLKVQRENTGLAKACANAVFEMIRDQQKVLSEPYRDEIKSVLEKIKARMDDNFKLLAKARKSPYQIDAFFRLNELISLTQQADALQRSLSRGTSARLLSSIYVSGNPVSPRQGVSIAVGLILGLMTGVLIALGKKVIGNPSDK